MTAGPLPSLSPEVKEAQAKKVVLKQIRKRFNKVKSVLHAEITVKSNYINADKLMVITIGPVDDRVLTALGMLLPKYINTADLIASGNVPPGKGVLGVKG